MFPYEVTLATSSHWMSETDYIRSSEVGQFPVYAKSQVTVCKSLEKNAHHAKVFKILCLHSTLSPRSTNEIY